MDAVIGWRTLWRFEPITNSAGSRLRRAGLVLPVVALALAGCNRQEAAAPEVRPVRTMVVDIAPLENDNTAVGDVEPRYESDLGFLVSGRLTARYVDIGDVIKKGDVLAKIDDTDYQNKLRSAQADVTSAQASLVNAQASEQRQKQLLADGATTKSNYDSALANLNSAQAQLDASKASADLATSQIGYTELKAEFDGVVTATGAEVGQIVSTGQMVIRLARPEDRDAVFSISENALKYQGDKPPPVHVALLSDPSITAEGELREVSPIADSQTRTFKVKITLKNPPPQMRFGSSVVGRMKMSSEPVVVLPGSALFDQAGKPAVWKYDPATETVSLKPIVVARYETDKVIVASGLDKGEVIVTAGVNRLRDKMKVRLLDGAAK